MNGTMAVHEKDDSILQNGDASEILTDPRESTSKETVQFKPSNLSNYESDIKKITQKIYTLAVSSEMKGNILGGVDGDTLSSSSTGCLSPMSSEGGVYPQELMDNFALNLHR